jgi:AcrR family transcriptional regulator
MLEAAERVIARDGYSALASRRVAEEAGLKQQLIYYYFHNMEELIVATYRHRAEAFEDRMKAALASERPWRAYWEVMSDRRTRLFTEYMSMANRSEALHAEMKRTSARLNRIQADAVAQLLEPRKVFDAMITPSLLVFLIASVARSEAAERELGILACADDLDTFIQGWLSRLEPQD